MEFSKYAEVNPKCGRVPESFYYIDLECVNAGEIKDLRIEIANTAPSRAQRLLMLYDILFQTVRPYQRNNYHFKVENDLPTVASTGYAVFRTEQCSEYLYELIHTERFLSDIMKRCTGTSFPAVSSSDIEDITVWIPDIQEQKKIGDLLTLVDDKIAKQRLLIEHLKKYKRGLLSHLFRESSTWRKVKLGEISTIQTGKLDANAMVEDGAYPFFTCARENYYIDKYAFDTDALLISGNGANVGYIHHYKGKFNAYQRTYVLDAFTENIHYVQVYLEKYLGQRIEYEKKAGNTPYIVLSTLSDMAIAIPERSEMELITYTIGVYNHRVELEEQQLEKLVEQRRGMLQRLFI